MIITEMMKCSRIDACICSQRLCVMLDHRMGLMIQILTYGSKRIRLYSPPKNISVTSYFLQLYFLPALISVCCNYRCDTNVFFSEWNIFKKSNFYLIDSTWNCKLPCDLEHLFPSFKYFSFNIIQACTENVSQNLSDVSSFWFLHLFLKPFMQS